MKSWRESTKWLLALICVVLIVLSGCTDDEESQTPVNEGDSDVGVDAAVDAAVDVGDVEDDVSEECESDIECPSGSHGQPRCIDQMCTVECDVGARLCDDNCVLCPDGAGIVETTCSAGECVPAECDDGFELCGGECAQCPGDGAGSESFGCSGDQCVISDCEDGYRYCDGDCAECPDDDPNGAPQCDGAECVLTCNADFHECSGECVPSDSPDSCGGSCQPCPSDDAGEAICTDSLECSLECFSGYQLCDESCAECPDGSEVLSTTCDGAQCIADACDSPYWECEGACCRHPDSERIHNHASVETEVDIVVDDEMRPHIAFGIGNAMIVQSWDGQQWIERQVDDGSEMADASIDIDDDGTLHVVYRHVDDSSLKYGRETDTGWVRTTVDPAISFGSYASIEVDSDGNPHIAYRDVSEEDVKYAFYDGDDWTVETVHESIFDGGRKTSLALDHEGKPHITYYDINENAMRHALSDDGSWSNQVIASAGSSDTEMTADDDGELHLAYRGSDWTQNYAHFDGEEWSTSLVSSHEMFRTSIALDGDGNPEIFFTRYIDSDPAANHLRYDGSEWIETEDVLELGTSSSGNPNRSLAFTIDDDGVRHLGYLRGNSDDSSTRGTYYYNE